MDLFNKNDLKDITDKELLDYIVLLVDELYKRRKVKGK